MPAHPARILVVAAFAFMACAPARGGPSPAAPAVSATGAAVPLPAGALRRMTPEGGPVLAVAFAPDGKLLASGDEGGSVRLWEAATGKQVRRLRGHAGPVRSVAFSRDGSRLLSGGADRDVRLWDVARGKELRRLPGDPGGTEAVAFAPDGKTVAAAGPSGVIHLWEVDTGREVRRLRGHHRTVHALAFAPGGKVLASGGADRTIRFWDPATGKELRQARAPGWVFAVAFSRDGARLASGGQDQMVHLWDAATAEGLGQFGGYEGPVRAVALSADGRTAAAGSDDGVVRLWEAEPGRVRRSFAGHRGPVRAVALAPDGHTLASGGADGVLLVWDVTGRLRDGRLRPADLSPKAWQARWNDLGGTDAARAYRALWQFAATPGRAVPVLREGLGPLLEVQARVRRLIADLDSPRYAVRRKAFAGLERLGELALPGLGEALPKAASVEMRLRLNQLERRLRRDDEDQAFSVRLQVLRAVEVLEQIGTPEARQLLDRLARGLPVDWGRREAKRALKRLGGRERLAGR